MDTPERIYETEDLGTEREVEMTHKILALVEDFRLARVEANLLQDRQEKAHCVASTSQPRTDAGRPGPGPSVLRGPCPSRHVPWGLGALSRRLLAVLTLAILGPQLFGEALQPTFGGLDLRLRFAPCLLGARLEFFIHEALRLDQCLLGLGAGLRATGQFLTKAQRQ